MFYLTIVNKLLRHCHSWLARQYYSLFTGFESKHEEVWTTNAMVVAYGDVPLMENLDAEGFSDGGFVSFIMCLKRNITDTVTYQKDLRFPFAVIAQSISGVCLKPCFSFFCFDLCISLKTKTCLPGLSRFQNVELLMM